MKVHGVVTKPPDVVDAPHTPDTDAQPFDKNPSIADPMHDEQLRPIGKPEEGDQVGVLQVAHDAALLYKVVEVLQHGVFQCLLGG